MKIPKSCIDPQRAEKFDGIIHRIDKILTEHQATVEYDSKTEALKLKPLLTEYILRILQLMNKKDELAVLLTSNNEDERESAELILEHIKEK